MNQPPSSTSRSQRYKPTQKTFKSYLLLQLKSKYEEAIRHHDNEEDQLAKSIVLEILKQIPSDNHELTDDMRDLLTKSKYLLAELETQEIA